MRYTLNTIEDGEKYRVLLPGGASLIIRINEDGSIRREMVWRNGETEEKRLPEELSADLQSFIRYRLDNREFETE